jgi:myo-inositol-1(or 4)-monophosphatase
MNPLLTIAVKAARSAGNIIARYSDQVDSLSIITKQRNDFVSEVDKLAEKAIIDMIKVSYPEHAILAEETGKHEGSGDGKDYLWIIDPLDGTTNFLHGIPQYAVSIAVQHKKSIIMAVIYNPINGELFTASKGAGAWLNDKRIRVSKHKSLEGSIIGTGFPYRKDQSVKHYLPVFETFMKKTAGLRRPGAASLDLAYIAAGRYDGFFEMGLNKWDIAAGVLIIREAGGLIGDLKGEGTYLETGNIVAANPKIFHQMLITLKPFADNYS